MQLELQDASPTSSMTSSTTSATMSARLHAIGRHVCLTPSKDPAAPAKPPVSAADAGAGAGASEGGWPVMVPPKDPAKPRLAIISTVWAYFTHPEHMGDCSHRRDCHSARTRSPGLSLY